MLDNRTIISPLQQETMVWILQRVVNSQVFFSCRSGGRTREMK
ncbi:hypothetical protein L916_10648, partial [Phytophthora nicotianae]